MNVMNRRIHVLALSLAGGVTAGIGVAALALWAVASNHEPLMLLYLAEIYPNYCASATGSLWGALWGFCDTFAGLFIFGLLYNLFAGKPKTG